MCRTGQEQRRGGRLAVVSRFSIDVIAQRCAGAPSAKAQGIGRSGSYVRPPNADSVISMDKLLPLQRDQFMQIRTRMMQAEMEHEQARCKWI